MKFDNCKVISVKFNSLTMFSRFFTDNGVGYTKTGESTCIDDYSQNPIKIDSESMVWVKDEK